MTNWLRQLLTSISQLFASLFIGLIRILPASWAYALGKGLAQFTWATNRRWRANAHRNFELFFKDGLPRAEYPKLGRQHAAHFGWYLIEFIRMGFMPVERGLGMVVESEGEEHYAAALAQGKGAIALAMHYGNWDLCGAYITNRLGQLHAVGKQQPDPLIDKLAFSRRARYGIKNIIAGKRANSAILKALKDNEVLGLLCDLNGGTTGIFALFCGIPASTVPGPAALALKTGAPLLLTYTRRIAPGRHRFVVLPPLNMGGLPEGREEAYVEVLSRINLAYEREIRKDPAQWLWNHKRWKTRPPGEAWLY